jgi:predicted transcriptional regulator
MKVLLSIKPAFAEKIFNGSKKYEYRRSLFKNPDIKTLIVYASSPVQKVIGEFEIEEIITLDLQSLWEQTEAQSGISKDYYLQYFQQKQTGNAIKIKNTTRYKTPKCLRKDFNLSPPQSFLYVA